MVRVTRLHEARCDGLGLARIPSIASCVSEISTRSGPTCVPKLQEKIRRTDPCKAANDCRNRGCIPRNFRCELQFVLAASSTRALHDRDNQFRLSKMSLDIGRPGVLVSPKAVVEFRRRWVKPWQNLGRAKMPMSSMSQMHHSKSLSLCFGVDRMVAEGLN